MNAPLYVNNTGADLRDFHDAIANCVRALSPLPEDLADVLSLEFVTVDGAVRGVVAWA